MAAAGVNWHGQHLPVVREIVRIGGVETVVEIPKLAEPELRQIVALLATLDRFERVARLAPDLLLERVAGLYIKHGGTVETWRAYETMLGVPRSKTRRPTSMFQPFLRWANGGEPDFTGRLAKLAAPLDEWVELDETRPSPITSAPGTSEFAEWLDENRGYTNVAERRRERRDKNYSESEFAKNILPSLSDPRAGEQANEITARRILVSCEQRVLDKNSRREGRSERSGHSQAPRDGLHVGDCLEVLASQEDASINLIMTSPPYADAREGCLRGNSG
jgi:hypothetical protein